MYCKYCGTKVDDDSRYCPKCGKSLVSAVMEENISLRNDSNELSKHDETLNVKISKEKVISEPKIRQATKQVLKHLLYAGLLVLVAFIIKSIAYNISMSTDIPVVTEEDQANFNEEFFKLQYPNGLPSLEELKANNYEIDNIKYPQNHNFSFGLIAIKYLKLGYFKYDSQINRESQLNNITESREAVLINESQKIADTTFNICMVSLVGGYFLILFIKWLFKKD